LQAASLFFAWEVIFKPLRYFLPGKSFCGQWGSHFVGIPPRVAMELMRHSDIRLTMGDYTDETILPLAREVGRVPSLKSSLLSFPQSWENLS